MKIDTRALFVIDRLNSAGHEAYVVGGCVRDQLLGDEPKDWDVATSAHPTEVLKIFADNHVIETGLKHGTVTVISDGLPVEVTTFRIESGYEDNRHPSNVEFVRSLHEDLARRDFTINAIAYHPGKGLIDPFNGASDLDARLLRSVGNPGDRFREDGLRILRALRFASVLSLKIEDVLSSSIHSNRELLNNISPERISAEMTKLLCGDNVLNILTAYPDVLSVFIPEISAMVGFDQKNPYHLYDVWTHTALTVAAAPKDAVLRLAMLFHDTGKPSCFTQDENNIGHFYEHEDKSSEIAKVRLRELKFDNDTVNAVCELIRWHDIQLTEKNLIKWLNRLGEFRLRQLFAVKAADAKSHTPDNEAKKLSALQDREVQLNDILEQGKAFSLKDLAIDGNDLLAAGILEGPEIGFILQELLDAVMDDRIDNERQTLLQSAKMLCH